MIQARDDGSLVQGGDSGDGEKQIVPIILEIKSTGGIWWYVR